MCDGWDCPTHSERGLISHWSMTRRLFGNGERRLLTANVRANDNKKRGGVVRHRPVMSIQVCGVLQLNGVEVRARSLFCAAESASNAVAATCVAQNRRSLARASDFWSRL